MSRTDVLTQDELLVSLRKLLETTEHGANCYISHEDTFCTCLVGRLKAALPRCVYQITTDNGKKTYRCVSIAHPDEPYKHLMGGENV